MPDPRELSTNLFTIYPQGLWIKSIPVLSISSLRNGRVVDLSTVSTAPTATAKVVMLVYNLEMNTPNKS